jgi:diguanylate cyclase (GGDEF)-like protein
MATFKRKHPTIGVLPGHSVHSGKTPNYYRAPIMKGIQTAASARKCHLLAAWGLGRVTQSGILYPPWPTVSPDSDFLPIGPWNTDGLIVFSSIQHELRSRYLQELREQGFPVLFIATGEAGPQISADNETGIYRAVEHMVVVHGHRHIAFIAGQPEDTGDSRSRLQAFHSAMAKLGVDTNPDLIVYGMHSAPGGYTATQQLIKTGHKFTALIASNDASAVGAIRAIRETTSLRIPHDIAIIGFDDQPLALAQVPPLASIHVPLTEIGQQALTIMSDHLVYQRKLESIQIPTRLIPRQSCGCVPYALTLNTEKEAEPPAIIDASGSDMNTLNQIRHKLINEMIAALPHSARFPFGERTHGFCVSLIDAFYKSLEEESDVYFQEKLMDIVQAMELADENVDSWQNSVSALRQEIFKSPLRAQTKQLAEDMLHRTRAALSESTQRQIFRYKYHQSIMDQALGELTTQLSATLDEQQAVEILEENLEGIGIKHVRVALFEADENDPVAWSVMLNPRLDPLSQRFPSRGFPPPGLYSPEEILNLLILPLVFQDESLGYVVFDAENSDPCTTLARQLASTIKASRLHKQVTELSLKDPLTGIHNRRYFDLFLNNEVNRSRRLGKGMSVIMLDIDHFKAYNDTFGHPAGDRVIQNVALCIKEGRRNADVAARIGGEEFALILPETQTEGALIVAEKIQENILNSTSFENPITVSMGISTLTQANTKAEEIVKEADLALYEAKQTGRNRICIFKDAGKSS